MRVLENVPDTSLMVDPDLEYRRWLRTRRVTGSGLARGLGSRGISVDWEAWARRAERALDVENRGDWKSLFAPNATFVDPHNDSTTDLRRISSQTRHIFPDWTQEITSIRGSDTWAFFEWIGRATYTPPGPSGVRIPVTMHGATIIEVDADELVTYWRDYLDRKEPEEQILAGLKNGSAA